MTYKVSASDQLIVVKMFHVDVLQLRSVPDVQEALESTRHHRNDDQRVLLLLLLLLLLLYLLLLFLLAVAV
jgi:hypothetical protein